MSRILRRPMFRGGPVSSYGTGIASGLANGGMPAKRGFVDGPGGYAGEDSNWKKFMNWTSRNVPDNSGITGANILENTWMQDGKKIYGKSSPFGDKPKIEDLVGTGQGIGRPDPNDPLLQYLYASGDDPESESTDVFSKEWVNEEAIKENELKAEHEESGSQLPYEQWKAINADIKNIEKAETSALTLGGTGGEEILGITKETEGLVDGKGKVIEPPESYEINADDVRAQAELFKELLGEKSEEKIKSAQISDASDYALQFFRSTVGEGKGMKEAAGDVAGFALSKDSKTEGAKAAADKVEQTATVLAINDAIASKRSKESIDQLIAKSGLDLDNKKKLVSYTKKLTEGFDALGGHIADSKGIGYVARVKDGLRKSNLVGYPTVTTTSTDMADEEKFKFDPAEDVGKIFIETDTETAYVFDAKGNRKYVG